jgi:hypothetical protein
MPPSILVRRTLNILRYREPWQAKLLHYSKMGSKSKSRGQRLRRCQRHMEVEFSCHPPHRPLRCQRRMEIESRRHPPHRPRRQHRLRRCRRHIIPHTEIKPSYRPRPPRSRVCRLRMEGELSRKPRRPRSRWMPTLPKFVKWRSVMNNHLNL